MIKDFASTKEFFANHKLDDIFFVVNSAKDAVGLEDLTSINIVCNYQNEINSLLAKKNNLFCLADIDQPTSNTTNLLRHPATQEWINSQTKNPKILHYKPFPAIEKIAAAQSWKLLSNTAKISRMFEDKLNFSKIITELELTQPPHQLTKLHQINFPDIFEKYGPDFFIQFARGYAGTTTFSIGNADQLTKLQESYPDYPVKVAQKINGPTYSLNACLTRKHGCIIQKPFLQLTNNPELNRSPGGTYGNDYGQKITPELFENIQSITTKFATELAKQNFLGIFGLDFIIADRQIYLIECNPRLIASMPTVTQLQIINNEVPLLALHILELSSIDYDLAPTAITKIANNPQSGYQIIFRNVTSQNIHPPIQLETGIYRAEDTTIDSIIKQTTTNSGSLQFESKKYQLANTNKNEIVITTAPPDQTISPDIEYLRIQSRF